ncbi:MMPL family transporter [Nocardioides sp.]|uniref:MMPL family transporter n=1 Tax=Nocardioides sp. TaxID=35761 RepID=UPI003D1206A1
MEIFEPGKSRLSFLHPVGPRLSWLVVVAAILFSGAVLASGVTAETAPNATANLPTTSESAQAAEIQDSLSTAEYVPAIVVFDRDGEPLTAADRALVGEKVKALQPLAAQGQQVFPVFSDDGQAAFVGVPLASDIAEEDLAGPVTDIRDTAAADLPDGLRSNVTGGPAFTVDISKAFDGADIKLLVTTVVVVALLLLLTYRSPWLWLVPLLVVAVADQVAAKALAAGTHVFGFAADGATTGISSVLVFGAGTNYALLLIARYREELRREENRYDAMRIALGRAAPAILASSSTVVLSLLCLAFADNPSSSAIGYAGAIGIVTAVLFALLVLPAAMTIFGRRLFWPFVPKVGQPEPTETGFWARVASVVTARPRLVSVIGLGLLVVLSLPLLGVQTGLSATEQFRVKPESVTGQEVLAQHFPAGASQPTSVITAPDTASAVSSAVEEVEGVQSVEKAGGDADYTELTVVLSANPSSEEAFDQVRAVREAARSADPGALVGGSDAEGLDAQTAATRDQKVLIPLILAVVLLVLLLLLRSIVAAVLLVLTVVATYVASLGASWFAFSHWFGFPALDLSVPLLSFLFLVALGVDYNIFLTTRAREEAFRTDTTTAISTALAVTGGVITSAGVLLAAVFTVLGVLPVIVLTQIGVIVGFGVLLDTLLVRSVLVPALVALLGRRFWWPGQLSRADR